MRCRAVKIVNEDRGSLNAKDWACFVGDLFADLKDGGVEVLIVYVDIRERKPTMKRES